MGLPTGQTDGWTLDAANVITDNRGASNRSLYASAPSPMRRKADISRIIVLRYFLLLTEM